MKFVQKNYLGTKQILKFPDHVVSVAVTVSDRGIQPDEYGEKIIPAGTIVGGGISGSPVSPAHAGSKAAQCTTTFGTANSNVIFTAREKGVAGNNIKIVLAAPSTADQTIGVSVTEKTITVNLATDSAKKVSSTANDVIEIIMEDSAARALINVKPALGSDGSGLVSALAETALSGGADGDAAMAKGVLMNDVDVTYGPNVGAMIIHGFIDAEKIPDKPTAADIAALTQIVFL